MTLSQEQINYLQKQPNASELIRRILDDLIASGKDVEQRLSVIFLHHSLQSLERELERLDSERHDYFRENFVYDSRMNLGPKNGKESALVIHVLKGYDDAIDSLKRKIDDAKRQIVGNE